MDNMDVDHIVDVPDTPERYNRNDGEVESNNSFMFAHSGCRKPVQEGTERRPLVIDSGDKSASAHRKSIEFNRNKSRSFALGSSSSRNAPLFRKGVDDKTPNFESGDSVPVQCLKIKEDVCNSKSSSQKNGVIDLNEGNLQSPVIKKACPDVAHRSTLTGDFRKISADESRKRSVLINRFSSSHGMRSSSGTPGDPFDETINTIGSGTARREGNLSVGHTENKTIKPPIDLLSSPRFNRQKRLVRNGCISPHNIAKAKELTGEDNNRSAAGTGSDSGAVASNAQPASVDIRGLVAEEHNSRSAKGKEVINHPFSSNEDVTRLKCTGSRNSININKNAAESSSSIRDGNQSVEGSGGWRNTRSWSARMNPPRRHGDHLLSIERDAQRSVSRFHETRMPGRENGSRFTISSEGRQDRSSVPLHNLSFRPSRHTGSRPQLRQSSGHHHAENTLLKRQREEPTSSTHAECSTSASSESDVVFLGSNRSGVGALLPVPEVDVLSTETGCSSYDEDLTARQVEADEKLARELQEQLYNEMPEFGVNEVDAHVALALQQEDESRHAISRRNDHSLSPRGSSLRNLHRQSRPSLSRRASHARAPTSSRMTRLRGRFPGQPRFLVPSRERNSIFPSTMDVEMRMHVLEALEAFSEMDVSNSIFQTQRDFTEDDYEMLLTLDENNDQHGGASVRQINGLPQSTVQSDNLEEACAICLETPTIGDTIRHLPCLHKFHKDCIDPWLRRKTSCPVCKSSIT